jgi:hypothetical protein
MNNSKLDDKLKAAREPAQPKDYQAAFPQMVLANLRSATWKPAPARRSLLPRLSWGLATAACVVLAFAIGHWRGQTGVVAGQDVLANARLVQETLALFPNRVRAIVQDEHGLSLVLSEKDDVPLSSPLWVKVCDGNQCLALVTFSGQEVQLAGRKVTVLSDAQGGVLLVGSDFVWSSKEKIYANNQLKIEAKNLGSMAM